VVAVEYGQENSRVIILMHGGGLSWWSCREAAEILKSRYHVVLPILDGHAGSDRDFSNIESNAREIIEYIERNHGGSVELIGGLSLGGQILAEMLAQKKDICRYAVIESVLVIPMRLTELLAEPMMKASYGLIRRKWFSRLQFRALRLKDELYDAYYRDTCRISRENMTAFLKANAGYRAKRSLEQSQAKAFIVVGQREPRQMLRSARRLHQMLVGSELTIMKNRYHGEFSINCAAEYADWMIGVLGNVHK